MHRVVFLTLVATLGAFCLLPQLGATSSPRRLLDSAFSGTNKSNDCSCSKTLNPVCDTHTGETHGNLCLATCAGASPMAVVLGKCPPKAARCMETCRNATGGSIYNPICIISSTASGSHTTKPFYSPCIAQCLATESVVGAYKGVCSALADKNCAATVVKGAVACDVMTSVEVPSSCYGQALLTKRSKHAFFSGPCKAIGLSAVESPTRTEGPADWVMKPAINNPNDCPVDPCTNATCAVDPDAVCISRFIPPSSCLALWVDSNDNVITACGFPSG